VKLGGKPEAFLKLGRQSLCGPQRALSINLDRVGLALPSIQKLSHREGDIPRAYQTSSSIRVYYRGMPLSHS